ncbi:MAG: PqqD family protein [Bacteroidales bacterium]|nr:PqqD family protein [Bacteroidales bacterium]
MNFFKRRKILKHINALDLIPVCRHPHEITEEGKVNLKVQKFKNPKLSRFLISNRRSDFFKIKLDELGSATWLEIDSKKTAQEICNSIREKSGKDMPDLEDRCTKFLMLLYEQRYITFKQLQD